MYNQNSIFTDLGSIFGTLTDSAVAIINALQGGGPTVAVTGPPAVATDTGTSFVTLAIIAGLFFWIGKRL